MYVPASVNVNDAVACVASIASSGPRFESADVPPAAAPLQLPVDCTTFASSCPLRRSSPAPLLSVKVDTMSATTELGIVVNEVEGVIAATEPRVREHSPGRFFVEAGGERLEFR